MINNTVKVHNRNIYPLVERFKGSTIKIEANSFMEMDYDEAMIFMGQFHPMQFDKGGVQKPESYKWIEIDKEDEERVKLQRGGAKSAEKVKYVCQVCAQEFLTKNGLMKHVKSKHLDAMVDEDARDELIDDEEI
jgi:hypothetical protein